MPSSSRGKRRKEVLCQDFVAGQRRSFGAGADEAPTPALSQPPRQPSAPRPRPRSGVAAAAAAVAVLIAVDCVAAEYATRAGLGPRGAGGSRQRGRAVAPLPPPPLRPLLRRAAAGRRAAALQLHLRASEASADRRLVRFGLKGLARHDPSKCEEFGFPVPEVWQQDVDCCSPKASEEGGDVQRCRDGYATRWTENICRKGDEGFEYFYLCNVPKAEAEEGAANASSDTNSSSEASMPTDEIEADERNNDKSANVLSDDNYEDEATNGVNVADEEGGGPARLGMMIVNGKSKDASETDRNLCIDSDGASVLLTDCYRGNRLETPFHQKWYWEKRQLRNRGHRVCLAYPHHDEDVTGTVRLYVLAVEPCRNVRNQMWYFDSFQRLRSELDHRRCVDTVRNDTRLFMRPCDWRASQCFSYF